MESGWSRRQFLKTTTAAVVLGAAETALAAASSSLPKRRLGKTGEMVSCIGFGSGTRFCSIESEGAAQALLERAFTFGINYFDTAGSYTRRGIERLSEKRLGEFIKPRRKDIFLATKIDPRDRDGALRSVETSLKFLQTDYIDLIQIHSLSNLDDLDRIASANGVLAAVRAIERAESRPLHRHYRPQRRRRHGGGAAPLRFRHGLDGAQCGPIGQSDRPAQDGADPGVRERRFAGGVAKEHGNLIHESYGSRHARRQRHRPRFRRRAFAVQFKPARRQRHHRLRAIGTAGAKRSSRDEFYPDRRNRQAETARTSCTVALSLGEILAHA